MDAGVVVAVSVQNGGLRKRVPGQLPGLRTEIEELAQGGRGGT